MCCGKRFRRNYSLEAVSNPAMPDSPANPPSTLSNRYPVSGAGLGLRRGLLRELAHTDTLDFDFMEVAPENWIGVGGRFGRTKIDAKKIRRGVLLFVVQSRMNT